MAIVRAIKEIDSRGRIKIPPETLQILKLKPGDKVYFEVTKSGSLVIRKAKEELQ